jgi:hypothetical protein
MICWAQATYYLMSYEIHAIINPIWLIREVCGLPGTLEDGRVRIREPTLQTVPWYLQAIY